MLDNGRFKGRESSAELITRVGESTSRAFVPEEEKDGTNVRSTVLASNTGPIPTVINHSTISLLCAVG